MTSVSDGIREMAPGGFCHQGLDVPSAHRSEFSVPQGDREFRICNRPRVKVQSAEILGVAETPVQHKTAR